QLLDEFATHDVTGTAVRLADYDIKPGVEIDEGDGDQWPHIREQVVASDILILVTPTWMGHHSSVAQRALDRLDAELSATDDNASHLTLLMAAQPNCVRGAASMSGGSQIDPAVVARLRAAGCVLAEDEARLLAGAAGTVRELDHLGARRVAGEPLEPLLGWAEF